MLMSTKLKKSDTLHRHAKLLMLLLFVFGMLSAWLGGHYGLWPVSKTVHRTYPSQLEQDVASTKDPRLCRGLMNPSDRYGCSLSAPYQFAYGMSVQDCKANSNILTRDYCLASVANDEYYENPNDCNYIVDGYYRRFCHFTMQPNELLRIGGLTTWIETGFSLALFLIILYFFCDWYVLWRKKYPGMFASVLLSFFGWGLMYIFSFLSPFSLLSYHSVVFERAGCPPNTEACSSGGWISFPTPWGIFVLLLLMPIIYFICGKIVARLHRKHGSPIEIVALWLSIIRKKEYGQVFLAAASCLYLAWLGYVIYHAFAPLPPPVRVVVEQTAELPIATSTWRTYRSLAKFSLIYPDNASTTIRTDGITVDIRPILGLTPDFKDNYGDHSSLPNLSFYVFEVPLTASDPTDPVAYLKAHEKDEMYSMQYAILHQETNTLSYSKWCKPVTLGGISACYVHDDTYGEAALSQYVRYHYYFINNGHFVHVRAIGTLTDLSKASMLERRNYALLLEYARNVNEMIKSFSIQSEGK